MSDPGRRSRRSKESDTKSKALEALRQYHHHGEKVVREVEEEKAIFDLVPEEEYNRIVQKRRGNEWIIDDNGSGYVDDGREIFEDDGEPSPSAGKSSLSEKGASKGSSKPNFMGSIGVAFLKSKKKTEEDVHLGNDELLEDILKTIDSPKVHTIGLKSNVTSPFSATSSTLGGRAALPQTNTLSTSTTPSTSRTLRAVTPRVLTSEVRGYSDESMSRPSGVPSEPLVKTKRHLDIMGGTRDYKLAKVSLDARKSPEDSASFQDMSVDVRSESPTTVPETQQFDLDDDESDAAMVDAYEFDPTMKTKEIPSQQLDNRDFMQMLQSEEDFVTPPPEVFCDNSMLPTLEINGEKVLQFFWIDAYEDRVKLPGTIFLFGKVSIPSSGTFVSCCVIIKNIQRQVFLLPRKFRMDASGHQTSEPVTIAMVYQEFNDKICDRFKIMKFQSKIARKNYAFEKADVPRQSDYLEVRYSASFPALPADLSGETFSLVFGTNTSSLEHLLLKRKLKGPCWLNLQYPEPSNMSASWCKLEVMLASMDFVSVAEDIPPPPLVVASVRVVSHLRSNHSQEILAISVSTSHKEFLDKAPPKSPTVSKMAVVTKPVDQMFPLDFHDNLRRMCSFAEVAASEKALLTLFLSKLQQLDPDVLLGHDLYGSTIDLVAHRININKVPNWSRLGRLKRQNIPKHDHSTACGRLVCDTKILCRELIRCKSYDLTELVAWQLKQIRTEIPVDPANSCYKGSTELMMMIKLTMMDCYYNFRLMYDLSILPLAYQITCLCGNLMSRTLQGGRAERNEYLLLHAFHERDYICPDKQYMKKEVLPYEPDDFDEEGAAAAAGGPKKKTTFEGGLVLAPKAGYYDYYILLMDFNSLYPSIIQEYNICFTTVDRGTSESQNDPYHQVVDPDQAIGVLPTEIKKLVDRRRQVKQLMKNTDKDSDLYLQYNIRQSALKLTANSMYGCLGYTGSRFHARHLAALVTRKGREILGKTRDLAQSLNLDVIYGDTDSIMVNTNCADPKDALRIGQMVKTEVNKQHRHLEIEIDGIFKSMLLLKKKKYAAVSVALDGASGTERLEMKGLDLVRRDWCQLAKDCGEYVLRLIFNSQGRDAIVEAVRDKLKHVKEEVMAGTIPIDQFEVHRALNKNPDEYVDKKSLPHVLVALKMNSLGRRFTAGDTVSYVICDDGTKSPAMQRAYHREEMKKQSELKIDHQYYLAHQIHPIVSRLCAPFDELDAEFIAESLGLDRSSYTTHNDTSTTVVTRTSAGKEDKFKECEHLKIKCLNSACPLFNIEVDFETAVSGGCGGLDTIQCSQCRSAYSFALVHHRLTLLIQKYIALYYMAWMVCDELSCGIETRSVPTRLSSHGGVCFCGKGVLYPKYSDIKLYQQLMYLKGCFQSTNLGEGIKRTLQATMDQLNSLETINGYGTVNTRSLFFP